MRLLGQALSGAASLYHRFRQHDGRGYGILRLVALGSNRATVVAANLSESDAARKLDEYRRTELPS